jgi:hypothetical protein
MWQSKTGIRISLLTGVRCVGDCHHVVNKLATDVILQHIAVLLTSCGYWVYESPANKKRML